MLPGESAKVKRTWFAVAASTTGAGPQGFAGTATKTGRAAGLTTLADDAFGGGPRMPMIPGTWDTDPPPD